VSELALELDVEAAGEGRGLEVHFSNFPGVWAPERPIAVTELGFDTVDEALARVDELGLPLRQVDVEAGSAPMPARDNQIASEDQARAVELATSEKPHGFRTHAEADEAAAAANVTWPKQKMTVAEKTEFLEAFAAGDVDEAGGDENEEEDEGEVEV
jgi:hypothetical protein